MSKLIIMRGLPASGKTTAAKKYLSENPRSVRVSKDDLRPMLHTGDFNFKQEKITGQIQESVVRCALQQGLDVVVDDTNLMDKHVQRWSDVAKSEGVAFDTIDFMGVPFGTCLYRNESRTDKEPIPNDAMWRMALQAGLWKPQKGIVIVDIDGTVADIEHRRHFVVAEPGKKNWKAFFGQMHKDKPRQDIIEAVRELYDDGLDIFFASGRPDNYREITEEWLNEHIDFEYNALFMRRANDSRQDTIVKEEIGRYFPQDKVTMVLDDRPSVIRMWREKFGWDVVDVGDQIEF